eukprot:5385951-Pyramimonas_sp.AAC.1
MGNVRGRRACPQTPCSSASPGDSHNDSQCGRLQIESLWGGGYWACALSCAASACFCCFVPVIVPLR